MKIRETIKNLLPGKVLRLVHGIKRAAIQKQYDGLSTQDIFTKVYSEGAWGKSDDPTEEFFSGNGSRADAAILTYLEAVQTFIRALNRKPNAVDLGCGDFYVGSRVRGLCRGYVACDIVADLIDANRERYRALDVDFRVLDLVTDELPSSDVVFIRQVLQHLSNDHIQSALQQLTSKYQYIVLTEHLPHAADFPHNLDKPTGPGIRASIGSGVVLTSPPFKMRAMSERTLCEVTHPEGRLRTILYRLH